MAKNKVDNGILAGLNFTSEEELGFNTTQTSSENTISMVPVDVLVEYHNHCFKRQSEEKIEEITESIKEVGVLNPLIVRPLSDGGMEIIAGHTRLACAKRAGLVEVPCIIRDLTDEESDIAMVDTNLQRENMSFSERAWAYRIKKEALDRQNEKNGYGDKIDSAEELAKSLNEKRRTIYRYIRLTYLIPKFLELVDSKKMPAFTVGLDLSYLTEKEQNAIASFIEASSVKIKPAQSKLLKSKHEELEKELKELDDEIIAEILAVQPKVKVDSIVFKTDLREFFPYETSDEDIENTIISLLTKWKEEKRG